VGDDGVIARKTDAKSYVDLRRAVRAQLRQAGLDDAHIDDVPGCTRCDDTHFCSHRRDGERAGRHLAVIVARPPT
jgi:copper oxidase (laccase) domain-containing protein